MAETVPAARGALVDVAADAGIGEEQLEALRLAASEALTNAIVHGYDGRPGLVHVRAALEPGGFAVTVADDGVGMHPRFDRRGMGLGLALIAEAAQELAIVKRPAGGTELRMRFAVTG